MKLYMRSYVMPTEKAEKVRARLALLLARDADEPSPSFRPYPASVLPRNPIPKLQLVRPLLVQLNA
jgi:hypothetical protein